MSAHGLPLAQRTLNAVLARTVARVPERPFLDIEGRTLSYRTFDEEVGRYAALLEGLGVARGEKVALMLSNSLEFVLAWFACARLGALYVPINTEYRGDILAYQLDKAEASMLVVDAAYLERLAPIAARLQRIRGLVVRQQGPDDPALRTQLATHFALHDSRARATLAPRPDRGDIAHTDLASICFTSGTTGPSKGVLSTHCHVVSFCMDWITVNGFTEADTVYTPLPLFHAIAAWLGVLPTLLVGARIAVVERFSATSYWADVRRYRASVAHGIFSVVPILLKQPPAPDDAEQPARVFYIGQQDPVFEQRFGCRIVNAYGSTETGAVTYIPFDEQAPPGSCGRANDARFELRLVDAADQEVPVGAVGEAIVRPRVPHTMMEGYYNDPAGNAQALRDGWFRTGDNLRRDAAGWHFFVDRKKDAIRRRGENISSFELEAVVNQHPAVLETAAVAMPSELGEDEVKLFVVRRPGHAVDHAALWAFCEQRMPGFWVPRYIEFIGAMPRTPNQKVMKVELRRNALGGELRERPVPRRGTTA
ncbi:AMP-binding protein [Pseudorhodoferax sp.]|uniref:AMP-binding protein n=1 Tax=Pseudorhodoferax sp. TaxID=1993553 RepID=UPI002DD642A9|nr:AMP-binding protein [Pseudorhodoferax sp.]